MPPAADPFHAVADPTRRAILDHLRAGATPVNALVAALRADGLVMSRPAVSRHLRVLRAPRLVAQRRDGADGRQRVYQLTPAPLGEVAACAAGSQAFWQARLATLKRRLEAPAEPSR